MGAVKNAMTRDGLDPDIMDLDHDKSVASQMKSDDDNVDNGPPLKEDERYQKYFKMLKMVRFTFYKLFHLTYLRLLDSNDCLLAM
jgi:hypothetical protein